MASADVNASPVPEVNGGSSGEFVLKKLFAEFVVVGERKLQSVCSQPLEYSLAKGLLRGEDAEFDQILNALNEVSSFCLRSVLTAIFKWRDMQIEQCRNTGTWSNVPSNDMTDSPFPSSRREKGHLMERRELAVEFLFCLVLVEVMPRLSVHPVPESFIHSIEDLAFKHFKQQESIKDHRTQSNPNVTNMRKIADLYAEVIGVLSQARFHSVRRRFFLEIRNPAHGSATIISIIEGMSFIRVKMFPVEELEQWFAFLQECAQFFLDCPREKIKAAMSALLVEVLLPVAAVINLEASLPVAKKLVTMLYGHCTENAKRARHSNTYIPLATVLLAVSEQTFFLNNWHVFLAQSIQPSLNKRGDNKIHNIALVSLYRLVWVYMVRIRGESNKTTMLRLRTVLDTLFPRGQRGVQPKDMPLNIFVKLIQFIARERLEYAMQEVILELLSQGRSKTAINPERMIIGLRAFLMITDSLEKKEGDPPLPINTGPLPSRGVSRVKTRFLSNTLTDETAKKIGIIQFYPGVRRALDGIMRSLDHSVGRQLTSTNPQPGKSVEEILSSSKPKLDLLKTCVAAIPRILPENMNHEYLTDLLSRLTIHLDHELSRAAVNSLHTMITNYPAWRHDIVRVFVMFLLRDVPDSCPLVLEATLKLLIQFIGHWRQMLTPPTSPDTEKHAIPAVSSDDTDQGGNGDSSTYCIPWVEACGLVTLCSYRTMTRRFSLMLLKEVRSLHEALAGESNRVEETSVMDVIESVTPVIVKRHLSILSIKERTELRVANQSLNLNWLADRAGCFLEQGGSRDSLRDPWALCLAGFMEPHHLPRVCHKATRLAWPYIYQRMMKAYQVLDPGGLVAEKGDKPPSIRGRQRPIISSSETFLWRNYLIFASCCAPPSSSLTGQEGSSLTARDLFARVVPLIRWDGEIREVAVTALGLVHPHAFGDLVEQLQTVIHDALEQRKDVKRRRRREVLKIQITRVFALAAEHGCFQQSHMARTEHGQISPVLLEFIEGIRAYLDMEKEGVHSYPELRLHFAGLVANIINSVPHGQSRMLLLSAVTRQTLFYLFANWCGLFGLRIDKDVWSRNPQVSFNSLQAMSALLCCGPVFQSNGLEQSSSLYRWLDNMMNCSEARVQTLGRKTVQLLLHNNAKCPTLLHWVVDHCYDNKPAAALCFHALSSTIETFPDYPCDMVTVLHVVLFKTGDPEHATRERAMQLLQLLDRRFLAENGHSRPELLRCLTGGAYSQSHVTFSQELASSNPELTFPLFSEMVYRFEMASRPGQRNILQYMVPWLCNVELVEENQHSPYITHAPLPGHTSWPCPSSAILQGTGWGSLEGTKVILHNLLCITAKYGEEHVPEVERLWSALCSWPTNLRITLNYLARLTCASGNVGVMVQQVKKIMVSFSRTHPSAIVAELIRDLQSVDIISADLQPSDSPPFYSLLGSVQSQGSAGKGGSGESEGWAMRWRSAVKRKEAVALPTPASKQYYASLQTLLKLPARQLAPLHRCNFALIVLSELVLELRSKVDWYLYLPLLLHVALLGLDLLRPLVYEHSKALLGNLVIVLACKNDMFAALRTRLVQQEASLRSPSPCTTLPVDLGERDESKADQVYSAAPESLPGSNTEGNSGLMEDAQELIKFITQRDGHRLRWPFADISSRLAPSGEVPDLSALVKKIICVFSHTCPTDLKDKWARTALHWATSCSSHQYASQSFQVCRALQLPLSPAMFREILTRLAESASDTNEDMQSYVLEIVLTLECALDHLPEDPSLTGSAGQEAKTSRKVSDLSPLPSESGETPLSPPPSTGSSGSMRGRHQRVRSITSKQDMVPQRPVSARASIQSPLPIVVTTQQTPPLSSTPPQAPQAPSPVPPITTDGQDHEISRPSSLVEDTDGTRERKEEEEEGLGVEGEVPEKEKEEREDCEPKELELEEDEFKGRVRMKITPLSASQTAQLGSSLSASPQKSIITEHFHAFSDTTALSSSEEYSRENPLDSRPRKSSEPPPSLMALFEHDMASSRRAQKQYSNEERTAHPKQSSFDSSPLRIPQAQGSPRRSRRMKSPVVSEREKAIPRAPSHPHLHQTTSTPHFPQALSSQPLAKACSIQQLRMESPSDSDEGVSQRSYSGGKDLLRPRQLRKQNPVRKTPSRESLHTRESNASSVASVKDKSEVEKESHSDRDTRVALQQQISVDSVPRRYSAFPMKSDMWRRNSTQIGVQRNEVGSSRGNTRPRSMVETSALRPHYSMEFNPSPSALVAQIFWTAVSLLESDFEAEFCMALRLISKSLEHLDLSLPEPRERLETLLPKFKWPNFPGVQALLLKGLTLESVADTTRSLLVDITPFCTQPVFDSSRYSGLPLNIIALMPVLVHHFSRPTAFCLKAITNIRQACDTVEVVSGDTKMKLQHMCRMFQMYSVGEFATGCDIWLAGICRYLHEAYSSLTIHILRLLTTMLEQGPALYHRPVLRLLYEYLRLQEPLACGMHALVNSTMVVVHRHLHGPLWKEAVDLLKLAVSNSAALVQPPTRGLPVDLGLFNQTLPGPTLQFQMDLQPNSSDLSLAQDLPVQSSWKNPAGSQRCTRERLLSVINACIPIPVLMSSPSVVFTDEQALIDKATLHSSASDETSGSLPSVPGDLSSQPEAQSLISVEFNFLDNMEYIYDSSSESESPPGPFSRPEEEGELEEEEEEEEDSYSESEAVTGVLDASFDDLSDLDQREAQTNSSEVDPSPPVSQYKPHTLFSQLLILGRTGETLAEEEEPLPEEPIPYSTASLPDSGPAEAPVHQHELSRASTLTGGSPESHDMSIESHDTSLEGHDFQEPSSEMVEEVDHSMEEVTLVPDQIPSDAAEGGIDGGENRLSAHTRQESELSKKSREESKPPELSREDSEAEPQRESREESEPPGESREDNEPPREGREDSEPPRESRGRSEPLGEGRKDNELPGESREPPGESREGNEPLGEGRGGSEPLADSGEPPTKTREDYKLPLQSRAESEPPVWRGKHLAWNKTRNNHFSMEKALSTPDLRGQCTKEKEFISGSKEKLGRDASSSLEVRVMIPEEGLRDSGNEHIGQNKVTVERVLSNKEHREDGKIEDIHDTCDMVSSEDTSTDLKKSNFSDAHEVPSSMKAAVDEGREGDSGQREREKASLPPPVLQSTSPEPSQRVAEASYFISVSNEEIAEVWRRHVVGLGRDKSGAQAVHTHFLFGRLFPVLRQQFTVLTREACNYLGHAYNAIASHFLVTVELLGSQLQLPNVYVDSELLVQTRLVDAHVFLTLEMDGNLEAYHERRRTVLERLKHIKLQLRQQSRGERSEEYLEGSVESLSLTPEQATLKLCQAVHRLHFQLLVLLGSYVKLLHSLQPYLVTSGGVEVSQELTEVRSSVAETVELLGRVPSPPLDEVSHRQMETMATADVVRALEDALTQKQWSRAVQLLRAVRRQTHGLEMFGNTEDDDVDCLFYIYAKYITDRQEGVLCITSEQNELSEVHGHLMAQNVSLHALLESTHQTSPIPLPC